MAKQGKTTRTAKRSAIQAQPQWKLLKITPAIIPDLLTIVNAAALSGMTRQGLHKAINQGMVAVCQIDGVLFTSRQAVLEYTPQNASGRPRSGKTA